MQAYRLIIKSIVTAAAAAAGFGCCCVLLLLLAWGAVNFQAVFDDGSDIPVIYSTAARCTAAVNRKHSIPMLTSILSRGVHTTPMAFQQLDRTRQTRPPTTLEIVICCLTSAEVIPSLTATAAAAAAGFTVRIFDSL